MDLIQLGHWKIKVTTQADRPAAVVMPRQVHGGTIAEAHHLAAEQVEGDGIVVTEPNHAVGISTADCLPLILFSSTTGLVLHVSRKTLIAGLLDKVADFLPIADIADVYVGPHICEDHFSFAQAGEEVAAFCRQFPAAYTTTHKNIIHLSLTKALQGYFTRWQVPTKKILSDPRCTFEDRTLPSYRRRLVEDTSLTINPGIITTIWKTA